MSLSLLREIELYLKRDLSGQKLSSKASRRRNELISRLGLEIKRLDADETSNFIAQQREKARSCSIDSERANLPLPKIPTDADKSAFDEEEENNYMDLDIGDGGISTIVTNSLHPPMSNRPPSDGGSGSGYESYASEDDVLSPTRRNSKENLESYFSMSKCSVFSYVYLETTKKFQKAKKWSKRVAIIEDNYLKCYKKPGDLHTALNMFLKGYSATTETRDDSNSMLVTLETSDSGDDTLRFYVEHDVIDEWTKALRESASYFVQKGAQLPPRVASRPAHTLGSDGRSLSSQSSLRRQSSLHEYWSSDDVSIIISDISSTSSSGGLTLSTTPTTTKSDGYFGKGIRTMTNMIWKDNKDKNEKKRMATAERLGAKISGYLAVNVYGHWARKWCVVNFNQLLVYGKDEAPEIAAPLGGCDLRPCTDDAEHLLTFKLFRSGKEIAYLEANSSEDMGRWVGVLIAETGCASLPSHETYAGYLEPTVIESVVNLSKESFNQAKGEENDGDELYVDLSQNSSTDPLSRLKSPPPFSPSANKRPLKKKNSNEVVQKHAKGERKSGNEKSTEKSNTLQKNGHLKENKDKQYQHSKSKETTVTTTKKKWDAPKAPPVDLKPTKGKEKTSITEVSKKQHNESSSKLNGCKVNEKSETKPKSDTKAEVKKFTASKDKGEETNENDSKEVKELKAKKKDINFKINVIDTKLEELKKYIDAAETAKEKLNLRKAVRETNEKRDKLEDEVLDLDAQIRRIVRAENKRPSTSTNVSEKSFKSIPSGNVFSKAKMFEVRS